MYDIKTQLGIDGLEKKTSSAHNLLVPWYLMTSYLYYEKDESIVSDGDYDWICSQLDERWDEISHWHKSFIDRDGLSAGSGYAIKNYPTRVKGAAMAVLGNIPND